MSDIDPKKFTETAAKPTIGNTFTAVIALLALLVGALGNFQALFSSGIATPLIVVVICIIIVFVLWQQKHLLTQNAVIIVVAVGVAVGFGYLSQPATISGRILLPSNSPAANLKIILINSNGINQTAITDSEGRFTIRNVPEGAYSITDNNGNPIQSGEIPPVLRRLYPEITIGSVIQSNTIVAQGQPTPTATISVTPQPAPVASATATASITPQPAPTSSTTPDAPATSSPTSTTTQTPRPSPTPLPTSIVGNDVLVTFRDDFDGTELSSEWRDLKPRLENGDMVFIGRGNWNDGVSRAVSSTIQENEGILILFQYDTAASFLINLQKGDFSRNSGYTWALYKEKNKIEVKASVGNDSYVYSRPELQPDTWYYLLTRVGDGGRFYTQIWKRDDPSNFLVNIREVPPGDGWDNGEWYFGIQMNTGTFKADFYEELAFPNNYVMHTIPPK